MNALAAQGHGCRQPRVKAGDTLSVFFQVGLALGGTEQRDVHVNGGAVLVEAPEGIFVVGPPCHDVDVAVEAGGTRLEGIEGGMATRRRQEVRHGNAQTRGRAKHVGIHVEFGPAAVLAQGLQMLRSLGE
ncbi:hypothetical protein D3C72_1604060 [compost metagenome]